ncbi:uncharacterized protein LOC130779289 [Actinidia eriantha]|uniref:uncharacterized protein LOC130779289 n=1 Tax=Actinidia eriantha TaxID=165200 RepID=UPI00258C9DAD|nr:uncharacterized protein LOC130779289 [Actinidia eriantha]
MKTLIILVLIGSAMLCLQVSGRRLILEEIKKEKANNPNNINGVTEIGPKNKPEKSSTYGSPKGGSVPAVEAGKENEVTNDPNSSRDDERNDSYGSYGNPAGSSTDTHHGYPDDRRPPPLNQGEK